MKQAYKYELDINNKQEAQLKTCSKLSQIVYNMAVRACYERFDSNEGDNKFWGLGELQKGWRRVRDTNSHLKRLNKDVPSDVPNFACMNVKQAFTNWWKHSSDKPREKKNKCSFTVWQPKTKSNAVRLPNIGWIRTKENIRLRGDKKSATFSTRAGRWFVSFGVDRERPVKHPGGIMVGIDVGLSSYITLSTGEQVEPPKSYHKAQKRLARWQRKLSRKERGSSNYKKLQKKIARLHRRIANKRKDFIDKLTTRLAKQCSDIAIEDLSIKNMMKNKYLSKAISDASWGMFRRKLEYKCGWYGCKLHVIDRWYPSTKTCSQCGSKQDMDLSQRTYKCDECGLTIDRDLNAAKNLKSMIGGESPESNASGESPLRASDDTGSSVASTNEEACAPNDMEVRHAAR